MLEACLDISFGVEELLGGLAHVDAGFLAEHGCVGSQHHHDPLLGGAVHSPRLDKQSTRRVNQEGRVRQVAATDRGQRSRWPAAAAAITSTARAPPGTRNRYESVWPVRRFNATSRVSQTSVGQWKTVKADLTGPDLQKQTTHSHTFTRAHRHTHARAHTHTHSHTHTRAHTHTHRHGCPVGALETMGDAPVRATPRWPPLSTQLRPASAGCAAADASAVPTSDRPSFNTFLAFIFFFA